MRFFPDRLRIRLMTSSPSLSKPAAVSLAAIGSGRLSNSASTEASSSLCRMISEPPRSPAIKPKALRMIDFPAPVSPVIIFNPGPKSSVTSSITAKFFMCSSRNIVKRLGSNVGALALLPFAPFELFAQDLVVTARRQLDQRHGHAVIARLDFVAVVQPHALLSVRAEKHRVAGRAQSHADRRAARHHDGPVRQCVRTDRRQHDGA